MGYKVAALDFYQHPSWIVSWNIGRVHSEDLNSVLETAVNAPYSINQQLATMQIITSIYKQKM